MNSITYPDRDLEYDEGGEGLWGCNCGTGPGARPAHPADAIFSETKMPVPAELEPVEFIHVGKRRTGRIIDGREWNEFPA